MPPYMSGSNGRVKTGGVLLWPPQAPRAAHGLHGAEISCMPRTKFLNSRARLFFAACVDTLTLMRLCE